MDQTTLIDYDAIVTGLKQTLGHPPHEYGFPKEAYLREFRTIGFKAGRQKGKTVWAYGEFLKEPDTLLLVRDTGTRNYALHRLEHHFNVSKEELKELEKRVWIYANLQKGRTEHGMMQIASTLKEKFKTVIVDDIMDDATTYFKNSLFSVYAKEYLLKEDPVIILVS